MHLSRVPSAIGVTRYAADVKTGILLDNYWPGANLEWARRTVRSNKLVNGSLAHGSSGSGQAPPAPERA